MHYKIFLSAFVVLMLILLASCSSVKPYQRTYLNDPEMQIGSTSAKNFENYVHNIREGAAVPGSTKASGGCGCN